MHDLIYFALRYFSRSYLHARSRIVFFSSGFSFILFIVVAAAADVVLLFFILFCPMTYLSSTFILFRRYANETGDQQQS